MNGGWGVDVSKTLFYRNRNSICRRRVSMGVINLLEKYENNMRNTHV